MFKVNPYNTSAGRVLNIDKLKAILKEYIVLHGNSPLFNHITMPIKTIFISGLLPMEKDIPMFNLPIMMEDTRGDELIVMDIRGILKSKVTTEEIKTSLISEVIKNEAEYSFSIIRAYLMESYITKDFLGMNNIKDDLTNSFALWISTVIGNSYFLTPEELIALRIAIMYYYYALISVNDITMGNAKRIAVSIGKYFGTAIDVHYIERVLEPLTDKFETMNPKTIGDLVNTISICLTPITDKLKNLNSISLNQMLLTSWYGENSAETISISLEHPPTFAGLCFLSLNNNSYRATKISNIINGKLKNKKDFALNLNSILKNTNYR